MRKLVESTFMSLDGVISAPQEWSPPYTDRINSLPKHVASTTLQETTWNATVIRGDVAEEVAKLKAEPGQDLLKFGCRRARPRAPRAGLVDEYHFCCSRSPSDAATVSSTAST
jgi:dihydrofolate reductase